MVVANNGDSRNDLPVLLGRSVDAANASVTDLCAVAIDHLPITLPIPEYTPLIYDKAADSDPLRDRLAKRNLKLVSPHRTNR